MLSITLENRVALVTGSGRGIGQAIAQRLAESGAATMVNDLDAKSVEETVEIISSAGGRAAGLAGDLTAPDFPRKLVDATLSSFGAIDIIVNNAGYTWDN